MAKYGSSNAGFFLVGGYSLLGETTRLKDRAAAELEPTHSLGDSWEESSAVGLRRVELESDGFYDDDASKINAALAGREDVNQVVCWNYTGNAIGKKFNGAAGAFGGTFERLSSLGTLHKATGQWRVTGQLDSDGVVLHALTAETATGNTEGADSQDNTTSSADGGAGYLQVSAISGTGATFDGKVRHSADDVAYVDLITFAQVVLADARKAERKTVSGTVNRHLASSWTIAGTTPSVTFTIGFKRA